MRYQIWGLSEDTSIKPWFASIYRYRIPRRLSQLALLYLLIIWMPQWWVSTSYTDKQYFKNRVQSKWFSAVTDIWKHAIKLFLRQLFLTRKSLIYWPGKTPCQEPKNSWLFKFSFSSRKYISSPCYPLSLTLSILVENFESKPITRHRSLQSLLGFNLVAVVCPFFGMSGNKFTT